MAASQFRLRRAAGEEQLDETGAELQRVAHEVDRVEEHLMQVGRRMLDGGEAAGGMKVSQFDALCEVQGTLRNILNLLRQRQEDLDLEVRRHLPALLAANDAMRLQGMAGSGWGSPIAQVAADTHVPMAAMPVLSTRRRPWPAQREAH